MWEQAANLREDDTGCGTVTAMTDSWSPLGRQERVAEIDALSALEPGEATADLRALLDLAVHFCGVSSAALNIVTDDAQHQIAAVGVEPAVCTAEESMCAVVLDQPTLSVGNALEDPRFSGNPFVDGRLDEVRFYASTPLLSNGGW